MAEEWLIYSVCGIYTECLGINFRELRLREQLVFLSFCLLVLTTFIHKCPIKQNGE